MIQSPWPCRRGSGRYGGNHLRSSRPGARRRESGLGKRRGFCGARSHRFRSGGDAGTWREGQIQTVCQQIRLNESFRSERRREDRHTDTQKASQTDGQTDSQLARWKARQMDSQTASHHIILSTCRSGRLSLLEVKLEANRHKASKTDRCIYIYVHSP